MRSPPTFSRRQMLHAASCGFGYVAMSGIANAAGASLDARPPRLRARAQRVIFLNMSGGPAQMDTFDYKPQVGKKPHAGSVAEFKRRGESGLWVSELLPNIARHADKLCVLNGMTADTSIHAQSMLQLHTGDRLRPCPSMGSWVAYGLGTENNNLPGFISFNTAKPTEYAAAQLPSVFGGTPIGVNGEDMSKATISDIQGDHLPLNVKRRQLDLIQAMNRDHLGLRGDDAQLEGVIQTMELGFRMQAAAPGLLDISTESKATLERYRVGKNFAAGTCKNSDFGRQCLLARRFCEAGVRFIEITHGSWDQHQDHRRDLTANCATTDAPIAALLDDLDQRGLLEDTLVVWGGEFGRPGITPGQDKDQSGHQHRAFTFWMAGGGVKGGHVHGATNENGSAVVEGAVHFRDLHATILHQLGLDHENLAVVSGGRRIRLTGLQGGKVVKEIIA
ncbi:DUF1501 domain-containing protein [Prosthecobacter sp.]|uniref:DUF1501 domain-containing protein n=1 Tax=Prosthecobacter sp. TaxID=1965333 RepID=UPI001DADBEC5|nr:DUF1501 domain-containing protein [Prosthecobacter sp.]MCB1278932.1 DUF1501 domain-containing protein [Prosthecobacter sp.]